MFDQIISDKTEEEMFKISGSYSTALFVINPSIVQPDINILRSYSFKMFCEEFHLGISRTLALLGSMNMSLLKFKDMPPLHSLFIEDVRAEFIFQKTADELRLLRKSGRLYFRFHEGKIIYPLKQIMELNS